MVKPERNVNDLRTKRERDRDAELSKMIEQATENKTVDRSLLKEIGKKVRESNGSSESTEDIRDAINFMRKNRGQTEI